MRIPKLKYAAIIDNGIAGLESRDNAYDPLELYRRGAEPHMEFAKAEDIAAFCEKFGYLTDADVSATVDGFRVAQRRFRVVLNLYRCLCDQRQRELREAYVETVQETGIVVLPGEVIVGLDAGWSAEAEGSPPWSSDRVRQVDEGTKMLTVGGARPYEAARQFAARASRAALAGASETLLKRAVGRRLCHIQPNFENAHGFKASWMVRDLLQSFYLMLYFDITGSKSIGQCLECKSFFYRFGKRQRFCSGLCGRRNIQRDYWKRRGRFLRRKRLQKQPEGGR